uniref:Uncharacterized protein n=1 Tax=Hemiselmis andersenii TaxID=464988 RepID=A0A6U4Y9P1_HEMAN|mmetsp:Transcript_42471/g.98841  ORF Transcript_42471/g.98841 Transcript_42471/m.98841 type:complete len:122 (+) Transcript_42471:171-536(+)
MNMDFGVSGTALAPSAQPRATPPSRGVQKRSITAPKEADEVAVGSGLMDRGMSDIELENMCRLQYARWNNLEEYVRAVGNEPDYWPSGLIKSTKKKGDDCKFYWKKANEWKHFWGKASMSR